MRNFCVTLRNKAVNNGKYSIWLVLGFLLFPVFLFPVQTKAQLASLSTTQTNYVLDVTSWDTAKVHVNTLLTVNAGLKIYMNSANAIMKDSVEIQVLSFYGVNLLQANLTLDAVFNLNVNIGLLSQGDLIFRMRSKARNQHTNVKLEVQLVDVLGVLLPTSPLELNLTMLAAPYTFCSSDGNGTAAHPYQICTARQLDSVRYYLNDPNVHFKVMNDIDLTDFIAAKYPTEGWLPIGSGALATFPAITITSSFQGYFDGNGKTVKGLWIDRPDTDCVGLFGVVSAATVTIGNLGVEIARNKQVYGKNCVGGLAGYQAAGTITRCYTSGMTTAAGDISGGLLGVSSGNVSYCYASGDVSGNNRVGGLIGLDGLNSVTSGRTVSGCYASGNIQGNQSVGGLVGEQYQNSTIAACYASGRVTGTGSKVGGLVGNNNNQLPMSVKNCVAANPLISGAGAVNRLVGGTTQTGLSNNYALQSMLIDEGNGCFSTRTGTDANSSDGAGKSLAELQQSTTYSSMDAGWNFAALAVWEIRAGSSFPFFQWQSAPVSLSGFSVSSVSGTIRSGNDINNNTISVSEILLQNQNGVLLGEIDNPAVAWSLNYSSDIGIDDIVSITSSETGKKPSYTVHTVVRQVILNIEIDTLSHIYPTDQGNHFFVNTDLTNSSYSLYRKNTTGQYEALHYDSDEKIVTMPFPPGNIKDTIYWGLSACRVDSHRISIKKSPDAIASDNLVAKKYAYHKEGFTTNIYITNAENGLIAQLTPNTNHLGMLWAGIEILDPKHCYYPEDSLLKEAYLSRRFKIKAENSAGENMVLRLFFTEDELTDLIGRSENTLSKWDNLTGLSTIHATKYSDVSDMSSLGDFSLPGEVGVFVEVLGTSERTNLLYPYVDLQVPGFSTFYIHGGLEDEPLPVSLLCFNASCDNGEIKLQWQTASEINNNYFTIEKSADAFNFLPVTQISASGNSSVLSSYSFIDDQHNTDVVTYYRLKQTDFNGQFQYFQPIAVKCTVLEQESDYIIYPNPATESIFLDFPGGSIPAGRVEIYNTVGALVLNSDTDTFIDISQLLPGMYFIKLNHEKQLFPVKKFEKR